MGHEAKLEYKVIMAKVMVTPLKNWALPQVELIATRVGTLLDNYPLKTSSIFGKGLHMDGYQKLPPLGS